jgi:exoribonuclease R
MEEHLIVVKKYGSFQTFEGAKSANRCLLFDKVELSDSSCALVKRAEHPNLVGILQTTGPKYGYTNRQQPIYLCKPLDSLYPSFYISSKLYDNLKNKLIVFNFFEWESNKEFPRGVLVDLIGDCGDMKAERKAILINASPFNWPKTLNPIVEPSFENRMKLSGFTFNIDPDGCKDVDDCITIWDNSIAISIADVSAWVEANPWMKYAEFSGTSLYENGTCVKPMFPRILSEDYMSLVEGKSRLAYTLIITFTDEHISYSFKETIVKVNKSYTYDSIYKDTNFDCTSLRTAVYRLSGIETNDSHKWVEILMLTYNKKAGELLKNKRSGILRKQSGINLERAKIFQKFSSEYMYLCYESAKYCLPTDETSHSMLNTDCYAHASSPIRRYVDIINQFALKNKEFSYEILERFNIQQKRAKNYERDLIYIDLYENKRVLDGVVLDNETIFVPYLKKIIKYKNEYKNSESVKLKYYMNPQGIRWKDKILFEINKSNV